MTCFAARCACWTVLALAACLVIGASDEAPPPAVFPAESKPTAARIDEVRKLLASQKGSEAVQEIQAILTASGDDLVSVDAGPRRGMSALVPCAVGRPAAGRIALVSRRRRSSGEKVAGTGRINARCAAAAQDRGRGVLQPARRKGPRSPRRFRVRARRLRGGRTVVASAASSCGQDCRRLSSIPIRRSIPRAPAPSYCWPGCSAAPTAGPTTCRRIVRITERRKARLPAKRAATPTFFNRSPTSATPIAPAPTTDWPTFGGDGARGRIAVAPPRLLERLGALCRPSNERQFSLKDRKPLEVDPVYDRGAGPLLSNRSMAFEPVVADGKAACRRRPLCDGLRPCAPGRSRPGTTRPSST